MIDQTLIDKIKGQLDSEWEVSTELVCSLLDSYISVIEDNAELHKVIAKLRTENNELYDESAKDKGL